MYEEIAKWQINTLNETLIDKECWRKKERQIERALYIISVKNSRIIILLSWSSIRSLHSAHVEIILLSRRENRRWLRIISAVVILAFIGRQSSWGRGIASIDYSGDRLLKLQRLSEIWSWWVQASRRLWLIHLKRRALILIVDQISMTIATCTSLSRGIK